MYIVGVAASNAGKYVCVANNSKGVSRSNLILTVVEKNLPTVRDISENWIQFWFYHTVSREEGA